ncbi:MAG: histidine acid phosphatase, partial [Bacteroidaceae bacterium]|nr:histidine acid phosphatase [Bacteroidaceae bacterium]
LTQGKLPYFEANLLKNIVETADSCLKLERPGATLRFGHEVVVYPLTCLMELGNYGTTEEDPAKLDEKWRNYKIFPMASNVQLISIARK